MNEKRWMTAGLAAGVLLVGTWASRGVAAGSAEAADAVSVLQVQPDVYMLTVDATNLALETGTQGAVLVDTGPASVSAAVLAKIQQLSRQPLRVIIDTSADADLVGGAPALSVAGQSLMVGWALLAQYQNQINSITDHILDTRAPIVARQAVLEQMASQPGPRGNDYDVSLPSEVFSRPDYNFRLNGQAIQVISVPDAHTNGDSVVLFRGSDVVATGAVFDDTHFPVIDLQHGGSLQGELDAVNQVMNTLVVSTEPVVTDAAGTAVIPLHGPLCDQADLLTYRDMLYAVRSRIVSLLDQGRTLAQVEAANPAQGYETRYGSDRGAWTTKDFVDAAYQSLAAARKHGRGSRE